MTKRNQARRRDLRRTLDASRACRRQALARAEIRRPPGDTHDTVAFAVADSEPEVVPCSNVPDPCATQVPGQRVGELGGVCPVEMSLMLDPVRVVHVDEELRVLGASAPHILSRSSAERWLAQDPGRRCPLCNVGVLRLESDAPSLSKLSDTVRELACASYTGGENLLHKAVKCCDSRLFVSIGRFLPAQEVEDMAAHRGLSGLQPLELLKEKDPSEVREFFRDLPGCPDIGGRVVRSRRSALHGGSEFWLDPHRSLEKTPRPLHAGRVRRCSGSSIEYKFLHFYDMQGYCPDSQSEQQKHAVCGYAVLLVKRRTRDGCGLFQCPITEAIVGTRIPGKFDDDVFEPAIAVREHDRAEIFQGRVAARRGLWIGGVKHFDDFVLPGTAGAAAVIVFEITSNKWRLLPGEASVAVCRRNQEGDECTQVVDVPREGIVLDDGKWLALEVATSRGERCGFECKPRFTSRRRSPVTDAVGGFPTSTVALPDSLRLRERLVLVEFEVLFHHPSYQHRRTRQIGAVFSDFVVGRGSGSSLVVRAASRAHCVLTLSAEELPVLVAYDDGSYRGTQLEGRGRRGCEQELAVGRAAAVTVGEGDVLKLKHASVRLKTVSPVLRIEDNMGLAAFFDRTGDEGVSQTLTSLSHDDGMWMTSQTMDFLSYSMDRSFRAM